MTNDAFSTVLIYVYTQTGVELEQIEKMPLIEWLANNYRTYGTTLEIVTDRSQEGSQFCTGFGGIGGLLRYRIDFAALDVDPALEEEDFDIDDYEGF
jgi:peptide chain release factor subunit 1